MHYLTECFRSEVYSEPCQTSRMKLLTKIVYGFRLFNIFVKSSILNVQLSSEYISSDSKLLLDSATDIRFFGIWCVSLVEITTQNFRLLFLRETDFLKFFENIATNCNNEINKL